VESSRSLSSARLVALLASLLAGIAAALAALPFVFRNTPTDISRIGMLLGSFRDAGAAPSVVVFGNSVIMSGIDAGQLRRALPGEPLAWNCASTGQTPVESFLLTQELPRGVRTAVYQIEPVGSHDRPLLPQKYNTFYMFGFRPAPPTLATLDAIYGAEVADLLTRSRLAQVFESRWAVRQLADTQLRRLLRRDLALSDAESDLLHPQRYTARVGDGALERSLALRLKGLESSPLAVPEPTLALARALAEGAAAAERSSVFLVPPIHPRIAAGRDTQIRQAVAAIEAALAQTPARVVDAASLLQAEHFIDDLHPTNAGAAILTDYLAQRMREPR
jgi:hypothetical protein